MLKRVVENAAVSTQLDLAAYFDGKTRAAGYFEDRFGRVRRTFMVDIEGRAVPGGFVLEEEFRYGDGSIEHRTWRIWQGANGSFSGTAGDISGEAQGRVAGATATMTYTMSVPVGARRVAMRFCDAMHLMADGTLIAHARVTKWGVLLGHVIISFRKP